MTTVVVVGFDLTLDGKPEIESVEMLSYRDGTEAAANQAFRAARRAIIRCGAYGFDLPDEKYDHWRRVEMTFDATQLGRR